MGLLLLKRSEEVSEPTLGIRWSSQIPTFGSWVREEGVCRSNVLEGVGRLASSEGSRRTQSKFQEFPFSSLRKQSGTR